MANIGTDRQQMPYYVCETIGSGKDAEDNAIRPAIALHTDTWSAVADAPRKSLMLVRADHIARFDRDARIKRLSKSAVGTWLPDGGERDAWDSEDLAGAVCKRFLLNQLLGGDDLPATLTTRIDDLSRRQREAIQQKLSGRKVRFDVLPGSTTVGNAIADMSQQLRVRLQSKSASPSGTFTDDFSNAPGSETDIGSITPSGGTAWTRTGASGACTARSSDQICIHDSNSDNGVYYWCDDQSSANQYAQFVFDSTAVSLTSMGFVMNRSADGLNYIGVRANSSNLQTYKKVSNSYTQLGSDGSTTLTGGEVIRLESDADDAHEGFVDASSEIGPTTDAAGSTNTRQGLQPRASGRHLWLDNVEFGVLSGATTAVADILGQRRSIFRSAMIQGAP